MVGPSRARRQVRAHPLERRENWCLGNVIAGVPSPVWGWWHQCITAAREMRAEPLLWFRKSRSGWYVMLRRDFALDRIPTLVHRWRGPELLRVNFVSVPVLTTADALLASDPARFARPA